jgi:inorganic pyrophosphatase
VKIQLNASEAAFWRTLDDLIASCEIVIDRPRGSPHPRRASQIYPYDYGYLEGTASNDGGGIDVWIGRDGTTSLEAVVVTVDP